MLLLINVSQLAYNERLMFVLLNSSNVLRQVLSNVIMIDIGYIIITIYMYEMYCVTYHTHDYSLRLILLYSHQGSNVVRYIPIYCIITYHSHNNMIYTYAKQFVFKLKIVQLKLFAIRHCICEIFYIFCDL